VEDKAENIWPVIKAFWQENGLTIKDENPQAGIMETEWAENRAKIPMDAFRKYMGKVFDGLLSSSEKDQYHTRLERSKDGNSTEIYIVHYGMQEVAEKDETGYRWLPRPSDPELEATMLQLLMSKLGGGSGVLNNDKKTSTVSEESASAPKLSKQADGSQSILLSEPFDKSWRKVGLALDQAKIALADKDRSKGVYYLSSGKDDAKGKQSSGKVSGIQVKVIEKASGCEVVVNNAAGESNADTQKTLDILFKTLGRL
jgi:outer membrane protein assembly factor BamC